MVTVEVLERRREEERRAGQSRERGDGSLGFEVRGSGLDNTRPRKGAVRKGKGEDILSRTSLRDKFERHGI